MQFKAAMFDFDGTITKKGVYSPSAEIADALVKLTQKVPVAFCTGRQLESFVKRGFTALMEEIDDENKTKFLRNLLLFAENGALGYHFDLEAEEFKEFYRVDWPEKFIKREKLKNLLTPRIEKIGQFYENAHEVILVIRTSLHDYEERDIEEVYKLSDEIYEVCVDELRKLDPDFDHYLHVGNSGIGVVIGPAAGDKDEGIKRFADYLSAHRGLHFDDKASEILVVGDSPQVGGNDHYFLNGRYGTAYSVGGAVAGSEFPLQVVDSSGKFLLHDVGTLHLINSLFN